MYLDISKDPLGGESARRISPAYTGQHNTQKRGHTSVPRAGFETAIPVFEQTKTVGALDRAAIGTGLSVSLVKDKLKLHFRKFCSILPWRHIQKG